eukprot:2248773-Rhodomonas_salina.1
MLTEHTFAHQQRDKNEFSKKPDNPTWFGKKQVDHKENTRNILISSPVKLGDIRNLQMVMFDDMLTDRKKPATKTKGPEPFTKDDIWMRERCHVNEDDFETGQTEIWISFPAQVKINGILSCLDRMQVSFVDGMSTINTCGPDKDSQKGMKAFMYGRGNSQEIGKPPQDSTASEVQIIAKNTQIEYQQFKISKRDDRISYLTNDALMARTENTTLKKEITELKTEITALKSSDEKSKVEIKLLGCHLKLAKADYYHLDQTNKAQCETILKKGGQIKELTEENAALEAKVHKAAQEEQDKYALLMKDFEALNLKKSDLEAK